MKKEIIEAWKFLRENNNSISDEAIDFMKDAALEKIENHQIEMHLYDFVKVKLTKLGKELWKLKEKEFDLIHNKKNKPIELKIDSEGYSRFFLLDFFNIFGKHLDKSINCFEDRILLLSVKKNDKMEKEIKNIITNHLKIDLENESEKIDDIMDSLDLIEIVIDLEAKFDIEIPDNVGNQWKTIGDIINYLVEKKGK